MSKTKEVPEGASKTHRSIENLGLVELQEIAKGFGLETEGAVKYLKKQIRAYFKANEIVEMPAEVVTQVENLDGMSEQQVYLVADGLGIATTGKKIDRVKQEIRVTWNNKGITELPCVALQEKKVRKDVTKRENYQFNQVFTDEQLAVKAQQLACAVGDKEQIEGDKKSANAAFADRLQNKQSEINIISRHLRERQELVTHTCDVKYDFSNGEKVYYFNKEVVGRVKMTQNDYQLDVEFPNTTN